MDSPNEGLVYEGMLPLSLTTIEQFPSDSEYVTFNSVNENLLKANLILHDSPELDDHDDISLELRRQDMKISLLLELVGELLRQHQLVPEAQKLKLTSSSIECSMPDALKHNLVKGSKVSINLYISSSTPKPLKLFGELIEVSTDQKIVGINFKGLTQTVQDWMEKTIFQHHRRTVAQSLSKNT